MDVAEYEVLQTPGAISSVVVRSNPSNPNPSPSQHEAGTGKLRMSKWEDEDFSQRSFVGPNSPNALSTTIFPDNRPPKRSNLVSWTKEQIDEQFSALYIPHLDGDDVGGTVSPETLSGIRELEKIIVRLLNEKHPVSAMKYALRAVKLRIEALGYGSSTVCQVGFRYVVDCNRLAMEYLSSSPQVALELLNMATSATKRGNILKRHSNERLCGKALTLNNLGCYYKSRKEYNVALPLLKRALKIETTTENCGSPASTHLNICCVLSALGSHTAALSHAVAAEHVIRVDKQHADNVAEGDEFNQIMIMILHNKAVEQMWLHRFAAAATTFEKAISLCKEGSPVRQSLVSGLNASKARTKNSSAKIKNKKK